MRPGSIRDVITPSFTAQDPGEILIDALNVAWWCGAPPTLRLPVTLLAALLDRGHRAWLYFDASAPHQLAHESAECEAVLACTDHVVLVRSGVPADRLLLRHARDRCARVVSRDRFRDHRKRFGRIIDDPARLLAGTVGADRVCVPGLGIEAPLPPSSRAALDALRQCIAGTA
jgi:hypothetical protein